MNNSKIEDKESPIIQSDILPSSDKQYLGVDKYHTVYLYIIRRCTNGHTNCYLGYIKVYLYWYAY